jgi:hypothetical protein
VDFDFISVLVLLGALIALDFAAVRWGVDSRFSDVRSDFDGSTGFIGGFPHVYRAKRP